MIGGCVGTSNVLAGKMFDVPVLGTHAHSWIMSFPDEYTAFKEYARLYPDACTLLVDTYDTLKSGVPNAIRVFQKMKDAGFDIIPGVHPIVPVMLYDEKTAAEMASRMMEKGIYVVAFSYPVVPKGKARIRTQVSAAHTREDIDTIVRCSVSYTHLTLPTIA